MSLDDENAPTVNEQNQEQDQDKDENEYDGIDEEIEEDDYQDDQEQDDSDLICRENIASDELRTQPIELHNLTDNNNQKTKSLMNSMANYKNKLLKIKLNFIKSKPLYINLK